MASAGTGTGLHAASFLDVRDVLESPICNSRQRGAIFLTISS